MAEELGLDEYKLYDDGARYVDTEVFGVRTPMSERDDVVGYLGRLSDEKGTTDVADAAGEMENDFVFIGDGERRELVERRTDAEITGWVDHDEVPKHLNRLRLLVLHSPPTEGLPTAILESLACGTPVVSNPVCGVPDVVVDGETGFIEDDDVAVAIDRAMEHDLEAMSRRGRELIEEEYCFEAAVERYERILGR